MGRQMTRSALVLLGCAVVLTASLLGCGRRDGGADSDGGAAVVDTDLMAFLSEARAFHHQANLKEEAGDLAGAAAAMERLTAARRPHDRAMPEVEEVLADAYARLAELDLRQNDSGRAAAAVKNGLAHAPEPTYFRGHLLEVEGLVEEARAGTLADAGKADEAARARERAIQLLEEVVRIQDQVIQRSLSKEAGR
jgi:tetratricopeptide (TPR) repeat protein